MHALEPATGGGATKPPAYVLTESGNDRIDDDLEFLLRRAWLQWRRMWPVLQPGLLRLSTGRETDARGWGRVASGVDLFASLSDCEAEPTGLYFSRDGRTAWVHIQHAGGVLRNDLFVEITKDSRGR